jgi:hypothetical protein
MMVGDESCEGRQWMVDPECPWWARLRRAESLIDEIRHAYVGFVLNRLRNVYKHRRLPLLAATIAREGGR